MCPMKNFLMLFVVLVVGCILDVPRAKAIRVPMLDATELEKGSHVVVVGEVTTTVEVERTLRGKASAEYNVRFYETDAMPSYDWIGVGREGW
jgi:hypothetical protein